MKPVDEMIRFVVGRTATVVPIVKRRLPGRGIWVTATGALDEAVERRAFARGFKRDVRGRGRSGRATERLLERAAFDALAMAGKAGLVAAGFAKVEAALRGGDASALSTPPTPPPMGAQACAAAARNATMPRNSPSSAHSPAAQLDLALGRPNVVHAALLAGPGSETFLARAARLERFRTGNSPDRG